MIRKVTSLTRDCIFQKLYGKLEPLMVKGKETETSDGMLNYLIIIVFPLMVVPWLISVHLDYSTGTYFTTSQPAQVTGNSAYCLLRLRQIGRNHLVSFISAGT